MMITSRLPNTNYLLLTTTTTTTIIMTMIIVRRNLHRHYLLAFVVQCFIYSLTPPPHPDVIGCYQRCYDAYCFHLSPVNPHSTALCMLTTAGQSAWLV